jgi:hypothetical protein
MVEVFNHEALEERFGHWPSFHDAEIQAVRLDSGQQNDVGPNLELDVHVFDVQPSVEGSGLNFVSHSLVTMRFDGVEAVELDGFGPQNVLDELVIKDLGPAAVGAAKISVSLPSNNGLGGSFRCEEVTVLAVAEFEPGPRSVYRRS